MSKQWDDDLGVSATYLQHTGLTVAVVYGCSEDQMLDIDQRLRKGQAYAEHPMLILGIFAELERKRLRDKVEELVDSFVIGTDNLYTETKNLSGVMKIDGERISEILDIYNDARGFLRAINAVKKQVRKMVNHVSELQSLGKPKRKQKATTKGFSWGEDAPRVRRLVEAGEIIQERLIEICDEYDRTIDDCKMVIEDTPVHAQMVRPLSFGAINYSICRCRSSLTRRFRSGFEPHRLPGSRDQHEPSSDEHHNY